MADEKKITKHVTMKNFLQNPTGAYSASFARRDLIIQGMQYRYKELISKNGNPKVTIWEENDDVYFYFKIPSEKFGKKCLYDVIIKFVCSNPTLMKSSTTLNGYGLNVFSNSPNFMFTYAYVYNQDGIIVPQALSKLTTECLSDPPKVKNPTQSYGFEKSVYFALLYIQEHGLNVKAKAKSQYNKTMDIEKCMVTIKPSEVKLAEYNRYKKEEQIEKRAKKQAEKRLKEAEKRKEEVKKKQQKRRKTP